MTEIENFAASVAEDVQDENERFGSIVIALMIISIIVSTLRLMNDCKLFGRDIEKRIKNPGRLDKLLFKKAIRDNLTKEQMYLKDQIYEQILAKSPNLSSSQVQSMLQEAKNAR
jgi:hypothetical protein